MIGFDESVNLHDAWVRANYPNSEVLDLWNRIKSGLAPMDGGPLALVPVQVLKQIQSDLYASLNISVQFSENMEVMRERAHNKRDVLIQRARNLIQHYIQ